MTPHLRQLYFAGTKVGVSFGEWDKLIQANFEKYFYISTTPDSKSESAPALINRRGIYKDVVGASQVWTDYQLRPNFTIALIVVRPSFRLSYTSETSRCIRTVTEKGRKNGVGGPK